VSWKKIGRTWLFIGSTIAAFEAVHVVGSGAALVLQRMVLAWQQVLPEVHVFVFHFT